MFLTAALGLTACGDDASPGGGALTLELTGIDMAAGEAVAFTWDGVLLDAVRDCP
jgi:hypothetical protein